MKKLHFFRAYEKGQALLLVVLVMVVGLSVALSVASRSITNLRTSLEESNSIKAFSAAESGVEEALTYPFSQSGSVIRNQQIDNATQLTNVTITQITGVTSFLLNNGDFIPQDDGADIWFSSYSTDPNQIFQNPWTGSTVTISWGSTGVPACNQAAVEIIVITGSKNSPVLTRYAVDPCNGRTTFNNFTKATASNGCTVTGSSFPYSFTIPRVISPLIARVTPLYAGTTMCVTGNVPFPQQGRIIDATGTSGTAQRRISYFQGYETLPSEFFYAAFVPK